MLRLWKLYMVVVEMVVVLVPAEDVRACTLEYRVGTTAVLWARE